MIRILIADDHSAIRNGVKLILSNEFMSIEFGEASNATDVFKILKTEKWDVLILDVDMPGRNGLDVLKQLKDEKNDVKVLMFSMHPEEQIAIRALRGGALGYLSKDTADSELVNAVNKVISGKKYITSTLVEQLVSQLENPDDKAPHEFLSDRELEIFLLFGKGKTLSQIADEISLSVPTISTYRSRILQKMNMKTNADLINYAVRNNLV